MAVKKDTHPILVPYDFTPVSDFALSHAVHFAKLSRKTIILLNVLDEATQKLLKRSNKMEQFLKDNLDAICKKNTKKIKVQINYLIKKTDLLYIRDIAKDIKASMMFIGIDQPHTLASKTLRMIGTSPCPVYVVQGNIEWRGAKMIVFPVDSYEETRQKISCTLKIAKFTGATVRLFSINIRDKERKYIHNIRVKQIEKLLEENEIPFITDLAKRDEKYFPDELQEYAKENDADLFILMKTPRLYFNNLFVNPIDKKVLLNSQNIPSVYINPRDVGTH